MAAWLGALALAVAAAAQIGTSQRLLDLMARARTEVELGHYDDAVSALSAVVDDGETTAGLRAEALVWLGVARRGCGDWEGARLAFERASRSPGRNRESTALLVQALGGALPGPERWAEIWARVSFAADRPRPGRPTLAVVWPDVRTRANYRGRPVTASFRDVELQSVLRFVADASGQNLVVFPGVRGRVTLEAEGEPWDRVLDRALAANGYEYRWDGNVILVAQAGDGPAATADEKAELIDLEASSCWLEGAFPLIGASIRGALAATPRVYFKSSAAAGYYYVEMVRTGNAYAGRLPKPRLAASPIRYYAQAVTQSGRFVRSPEVSAVVVEAASACPPAARLAATGPDGAVTVFAVPQGLPPRQAWSGARIDVDYNSRDLREVLSEVAGWGGAGAEIDPGVGGRVTLKLRQVPWDQAVDLIAWVNGLDWSRDGARLQVFRRTAEPR